MLGWSVAWPTPDRFPDLVTGPRYSCLVHGGPLILGRLVDAMAYAISRPLLKPLPRADYPESEFVWVEVPGVTGQSPAWMRRAGVSPDGTIYLPVVFAGDEREMTVRAIREGQFPVTHLCHSFAPAHWIARLAPDQADLCASVERSLIHFFTCKALP
jgi:hypothetical protein